NVDQAMTKRAWRRDRSRVEAIRPNASPATESTVDRSRHANGEAPHAAGQLLRLVCLPAQMHVGLLYAPLGAAETRGGPQPERRTDSGKDACAAETRDRRAQGHVHGMRANMMRSGAVRNAGSPAGRHLSSRALTVATPSTRRRKGELHGACHLDRATIAFLLL